MSPNSFFFRFLAGDDSTDDCSVGDLVPARIAEACPDKIFAFEALGDSCFLENLIGEATVGVAFPVLERKAGILEFLLFKSTLYFLASASDAYEKSTSF